MGWLYPRGLITRIEKRASQQATGMAMLIKILFAFTGKPQNLINQIHFNTFGGSSYPGKLIIRYLFFCLPMAVGVGWGVVLITLRA